MKIVFIPFACEIFFAVWILDFVNVTGRAVAMANSHGFEFYDDTWQLIPPDYGATDTEYE